MPEIALTEAERLTDRLLSQQANHLSEMIASLREQIASLHSQHDADCLTFARAVAARAGLEIVGAARRVERDGAVLLVWDDTPAAPTIAGWDDTPAAPTIEPPADEPDLG